MMLDGDLLTSYFRRLDLSTTIQGANDIEITRSRSFGTILEVLALRLCGSSVASLRKESTIGYGGFTMKRKNTSRPPSLFVQFP